MRLMRICTAYEPFIRQFYAERPGMDARPYDEQYRTLSAEPFGWCDLWTRYVGPLGYECFEPIANASPAQAQWAREHGVAFDPHNYIFPITMAQIEHFKPDVLVSNDYASFSYDFLTEARRRVPGIRVMVGWCGAPYVDEKVFRAYDLMLTNLRAHVASFRAMGVPVEYMHHGFDVGVLDKIDTRRARCHDFTFLGSVVKRPGFHNERERLLLKLLERTPLQIFADVPVRAKGPTLKRRVGLALARTLKAVPGGGRVLARVPKLRQFRDEPVPRATELDLGLPILEAARPPVFGRAMFQTLRDSRLTLNTHIDIAKDNASNMRLFEATGVGTCMLTERQSDLSEIFEPDREVVTYSSHEECVEKAVWLLEHDKEREEIGLAGQRRVMRDHRWDQRAAWLDGQIRKLLHK